MVGYSGLLISADFGNSIEFRKLGAGLLSLAHSPLALHPPHLPLNMLEGHLAAV